MAGDRARHQHPSPADRPDLRSAPGRDGGGRQTPGGGEELVIFPQNVYEFWTTATRPPGANGLGLTVPACLGELTRLRQSFQLLPDQPGLFAEWESLVVQYQSHGRVSFDARIVAAMNTHGITRLLTFNVGDFTRYAGLTVLDPAAV